MPRTRSPRLRVQVEVIMAEPDGKANGFDIVAVVGPDCQDSRTLGTLVDGDAALILADAYSATYANVNCFVFRHVSEKTRLLAYHTLNNEGRRVR